jgi:ankyrin repeat protein
MKRIASLLIESGCDINAVNNQGKTALDYCDLLKYAELGHYLVLQGAENSSSADLSQVTTAKFMSTADIKSFR